MEHLPTPGGYFNHSRYKRYVRNYCGHDIKPLPKNDFMGFPACSPGFEHFAHKKHYEMQRIEKEQFGSRRPSGTLMTFLQKWLFWGLLGVVLEESFHPEDYIDPSAPESRPLVNTGFLVERLEDWRTKVSKLPRHHRLSICNRLAEYLRHTALVLYTVDQLDVLWYMDKLVLISITGTAECIQSAISMCCGDELKMVTQFVWSANFCYGILDHDMRFLGWCPADIHMTRLRLASCGARYYASQIPRRQVPQSGPASLWRFLLENALYALCGFPLQWYRQSWISSGFLQVLGEWMVSHAWTYFKLYVWCAIIEMWGLCLQQPDWSDSSETNQYLQTTRYLVAHHTRYWSLKVYLCIGNLIQRYPEWHMACTDDSCGRLSADPMGSSTRHIPGCKSCSYIGIAEISLIHILQNTGSYPVLRIDRSGKLRLVPQIRTPETPFVAISHVWTDGTGNKRGNYLPRCQICRLFGLVSKLEHASLEEKDRPNFDEFYVWIDTLCVPVRNRAAKLLALDRMKDVYRDAEYVLVRDATLERVDSQDQLLDCTIRLMISPWNTRVWTLQEGALPEKLLVQFRDRAIDFRILERSCLQYLKRHVKWYALAQDLVEFCREKRSYFHHTSYGKRPANITDLIGSISYRRVHRPEDEPLCTAYMLDLDVTSILKAKPSQRMGAFWRTLATSKDRPVPSRIIFHNFPRLAESGLIWAPRTFLSRHSELHQMSLDSRIPDGRVAQLTADGILVKYPAFELALPMLDCNSNRRPPGTSSPYFRGVRVDDHFLSFTCSESHILYSFMRRVRRKKYFWPSLERLIMTHPDRLVILYEPATEKQRTSSFEPYPYTNALIGRMVDSGDASDRPKRVETLVQGRLNANAEIDGDSMLFQTSKVWSPTSQWCLI